ncbi:SIS domain-containing protein [Amycolatopsis sp. NBC_01480]|uniref:SIS domain-containing protein n=1 Tax=Amycolatopsis sp. NBC_01480 TaxID=2903562 RepID=UPI002E28754D|nr:SIS domain-containing protein [Amycolatopsis sp. NBC_01480]
MSVTPFERDIADQDEALRAFASSSLPESLGELDLRRFDRIVFTGMGSSHFGALRSWRRLVAAGLPAWWVDAGQLLDSPELVTGQSLVVATSQSGASGEIVSLLDDLSARTLIGVTNAAASPLGERSDIFLPLCSGDEATVSTKSYTNTLAAHERLIDRLLGKADRRYADFASSVGQAPDAPILNRVADELAIDSMPRLAFVGYGDHAATALYAGLITKEAAKVAAEGYIGGQFRHGPFELAGPGLAAVLFGAAPDARPSVVRLAKDLVATGATVVLVGGLRVPGAETIATPAGDTVQQLIAGTAVAQSLTVRISRARGTVPGDFTYATKITTAL